MTTRPRKRVPPQKYAFLWRLMADTALSASAKVVAATLLLKFHNTKTGQCNPSFAAIAKAIGRSSRTIFPAIAELKDGGWITVESTKGGSSSNTNHYNFDFGRVSSASSPPVKPASPVKQNAEGVKPAAHEPSRTTTPFGGGVWGRKFPPAARLTARRKNLKSCASSGSDPTARTRRRRWPPSTASPATFRRRTSSKVHGVGWRQQSQPTCRRSNGGWMTAHGETIRPLDGTTATGNQAQQRWRPDWRRHLAGKGVDGEDSPKTADGDGEAHDGGGKACAGTAYAMANATEGHGPRGGLDRYYPHYQAVLKLEEKLEDGQTIGPASRSSSRRRRSLSTSR